MMSLWEKLIGLDTIYHHLPIGCLLEWPLYQPTNQWETGAANQQASHAGEVEGTVGIDCAGMQNSHN